MSNTGCFGLWSVFQPRRSRPSNDTDCQSEQKPNVISKQPLPQELQMGNIIDWDQSPTFPRSKKFFDDSEVELVEIESSPKRFKGCDLPDIGNSTYITSVIQCLNHTDALKDVLKSTVSCTKPHSDNPKELRLSELLHKIFSLMEHDIEKQDKQLRDIIKKIKSKMWGNDIHTSEQQDIILTLENILELINEEVEQILDILFFEVRISVLCPTNPHDKTIHQSIFLMPLPLPLVNDTFTFDEYIKTCLQRQSQAIKCEKCSATLDTDHMRDVHAKVLSTPSILILYTNCSTLNEKKKWTEDAYQPLQNQVKYEAYAYIEYKSTDTFSKKNAFLKWNDQWYKGSHPTDAELQWHGRKSLILFFRKQNDTGAVSFLSNKNTFDASVEERPKIDAESQSNSEMTAMHNEIEIVHNSNHLPVLVNTSEINTGSAENTNLCGLKNLGNTCYMNSALQCLVHTKPLREFVMSNFIQNPGIAKAFSDLVREMWLSQLRVVHPVYLKSSVEMLDPQFIGNKQQDAQELISVLINGLHEEFNQITGEKPYVDMKVDESKYCSEEEIEAAWKELRELRDKSEIINLFHVQTKITLRCHNCSYAKTSYDSLFPLSLPLPKNESNLTLESCLSLFTEEKQLANSNNCKSCHQDSRHFRKVGIKKLPPILMVYLKRFNFHKSGNKKIGRHVAFSCKFPIQEVYPNAHDYQLYAVINHSGSLESGHYISYIKCDEQWYLFNDSHYEKISEKEVCTSNAYILFYENTKKNLQSVCPTTEEAVINSAVVQKSPPCDLQKTNSKKNSSRPAGHLAVPSSSGQIHETSRKRTNSPSTSSVKIMKPTRSIKTDLLIQVDEIDPIVEGTRDSATKIYDKNLLYLSPSKLRVHPTICGLVNFGNTCYMNSALQCLVHTKPLREFIFGSNTADKVLAKAFLNLISKMWVSKLDFCQPTNMKKALGQIDSKFNGNLQQDAQELISILINDLHEEFNEITGEKPAVRMKVDESKFNSEEEVAAAWKKLTERRDKSEIINIFNGQIKTTLRCHNCSNMRKSYDLFFPLILPLPSRKSGLNLEDCLKLFTEDKPLSNSKNCRNCCQVSEHSRKVDIWTFPPILMVYLKRFVMNKRGKYEKIKTHVDYSFTFPFEKFCHTNNQFEYQLYAVINHWGSLEFGHYFSFIKSEGNWFECNDTVCKRIIEDNVISSDAYVLFYERIEKKLHCADGDIQLKQFDLKPTPNAKKRKMQLGVDDITPTLTIAVESINQKTDSEYSNLQILSNVNAALQCLVHTESLREFIISKSTNVLNKQLATAFFELINDMWIPERNICESKLAESFIVRNFKGYLQQDAQELICNFINSLHEEFNETTSQRPSLSLDEIENQYQSEEEKALAFKQFFEQSEMIRIFYGQMRFVLKCLECQKTFVSFKPLFPLIVPLGESYIFTEEKDTKYERYCKICNRLTNFSKKFDIWKMPSTLVVCHDREGYNSKKTKDARLEFTFPVSKFCRKEEKGVEYRLYAVIVQLPQIGHCLSYIKSNEEWYEYNNLELLCKKISKRDVSSLDACVLFYQRSDCCKESYPEEARVASYSTATFGMNTINESNSLCHKAEISPTLSLIVTTTDHKNECEETKKTLTKNDGLQNLFALTSVLRCLIHTKPLKILIDENRGLDKKLALFFYKLLNDKMSVSEIIISQPEYLKLAIEPYSQEDAQELISILISDLHEEFNEITGEKPYIDMKVDESKFSSEDEIAAAWKKLTELRDKSEIVNIFNGQVKTTLRCHKCSNVQISYDSLFPLSLPLPKNESNLTLESCLRLFTKKKQLSNSKKCKSCHKTCRHSRKADIWKLSPIVMVYLKRFYFHKSGKKKIEKPVEFSCKFPIQEFYPNAQDGIEYKLYAVINHEGSLESGYYFSYIKCDEQWYSFDGSDYNDCDKISEKDICTSNAYVLFYEYSEQKKLQIDHNKPEEAIINATPLPKSSSLEMLLKCSNMRTSGRPFSYCEEVLAVPSSPELTSRKRTATQSTSSVKMLKPTISDLPVVEIDPTNLSRNSTTEIDQDFHRFKSSPKQRVHRNICGLNNFGNTCYGMNSALQCLVHTKPLREFIMKCNTIDKALAKAFFNLIREMWVSNLDFCQPIKIKTTLEQTSKFVDHLPQDAQEFINLLINGLHEEFNEEKAFALEESGEQTKQSEIANIFYGLIKTSFKCDNCSKIQSSYEYLFPLKLTLPAKIQSLTLEDCLRQFAIENLSENQIECSNCQNDVLLSKMIELPLILVVCLDRFHNRGKIIRTSVKFSFTFPLEELCHNEKKTTKYQLYAVINHLGSLSSGHYYSYVKCEEEWYECKDKRCNKISENDIFTSFAYVLFFKRVELNE